MKKYVSLALFILVGVLGSCKTAPDYVVTLGQVLTSGQTWTVRSATYGNTVSSPNAFTNFTITFGSTGSFTLRNPDGAVFVRAGFTGGTWREMSQNSVMLNNVILQETSKMMNTNDLRLEYKEPSTNGDITHVYYLVRK